MDSKSIFVLLVALMTVCFVNGLNSPVKWWEIYDREVERPEVAMPEDPQEMAEMMSAPPGMRRLIGAPGSFGEVEAAMSDMEKWMVGPPGHMRRGNFQQASSSGRKRGKGRNMMGPPGTNRARAAQEGLRGPPGHRIGRGPRGNTGRRQNRS